MESAAHETALDSAHSAVKTATAHASAAASLGKADARGENKR
jgi:hypothetical protein